MLGDQEMITDVIMWIRDFVKEQFCWHDYRRDELLINSPTRFCQSCSKCGRIR